MNIEEDNQIMLSVKEGDIAGVGVLFERYHAALSGFFCRMSGDLAISEDLTQETFWRILRYRRSFKAGQPFRAWMYQIGRNLFYDYSKRRSVEFRFNEERDSGLDVVVSQVPGVRSETDRLERKDLLNKALNRLPAEKREVILLCRFEEMPHAEVAKIVNCSVEAVKVRLCRALKELKEIYTDLGGERIS